MFYCGFVLLSPWVIFMLCIIPRVDAIPVLFGSYTPTLTSDDIAGSLNMVWE